MSNAKPTPSPKPLGTVPAGAIGQVVDTVIKSTQQPGGTATLGEKLADIANQPKNPEGD